MVSVRETVTGDRESAGPNAARTASKLARARTPMLKRRATILEKIVRQQWRTQSAEGTNTSLNDLLNTASEVQKTDAESHSYLL